MRRRTYIHVAFRSHISAQHGLELSIHLAGEYSMGPITTLPLETALTLECQFTTCTEIKYTNVKSFTFYLYIKYGKSDKEKQVLYKQQNIERHWL